MAEVRIEVVLPIDRYKAGELTLKGSDGAVLAGPFPVLGKADNAKAASTGNPTRDPTKPWGDTPEGTYSVPRVVDTGTGTIYTAGSYGPDYAVVLDPQSGDALTAKSNGRTGLFIHSGSQKTPGRLRPTYGCLRLSDNDMRSLLKAISQAGDSSFKCEVVEISVAVGNEADGVPGADESDPPPNILELLTPKEIPPISLP